MHKMKIVSLMLAVLMLLVLLPSAVFAEGALPAPALTAEVAKNEDFPIDPYTVTFVYWEEVIGADGYEVQKRKGDGEWVTQDGEYNAESIGHTDLDGEAGASYTYRVRAYQETNGTRVYSDWSEIGVTVPTDAFKAVALYSDIDYVALAWNPVNGAAGYTIYQSESADGNYEEVADYTEKDLLYVDYPLERGETYYYKVRSYTMNGAEKVYGEFSPVASAFTGPTEDFFSGVKRLYGNTRYDTAIEASNFYKQIYNKTYDVYDQILPTDHFRTVIVANGENFADALAGSYLAAVLRAPIVLVSKSTENKVVSYIKNNLDTYGSVVILGGENAVSKSFEQKLSAYDVERLGGANRYLTNIEILKFVEGGKTDLIVCSGLNFADALSASSLKLPILLVGNSLTKDQIAYLKKCDIENIYIIGGTAAVSKNVEDQLKQFDSAPERIFGSTRYETSIAVARRFFGNDAETAVLAYGQNFPDGLSGSPIASALREPIILAKNDNNVINNIAAYTKSAGIKKAIVFGGSGLISDANVKKIIQ